MTAHSPSPHHRVEILDKDKNIIGEGVVHENEATCWIDDEYRNSQDHIGQYMRLWFDGLGYMTDYYIGDKVFEPYNSITIEFEKGSGFDSP